MRVRAGVNWHRHEEAARAHLRFRPALPVVLLPVSPAQVAQTADGVDADLWKDGLFKSKVTRYLCFTRSFSKENVSPVALFRVLSERKPLTFLSEVSPSLFVCVSLRWWFVFIAVLIYPWF